MTAIVKSEPTSPTNPVRVLDLESRIIKACQEYPNGIPTNTLQNHLPNIDVDQQVSAINRLLSQGRIDLLKQGNQIIYRLKDPDAANKVRGSDNEEKIVYQIIEQAGNKGIWIRDIRQKSSLSQTQVNKTFKSLESKKLIKAVKSVSASKKKVYMLYDLEPDRSVTGGAWYSDQDFESEFVEVLNQQCYKFLRRKAELAKMNQSNPLSRRIAASATSEEICNFIRESGLSKIQLSIEDIEAIMNTLIYDGKVEKSLTMAESARSSHDSSCNNIYRSIEPLVESVGLMQMPCGLCPVINQCCEDGEISPATCVYMKEWLQY